MGRGRYLLASTLYLARWLREGEQDREKLQRMWLDEYQSETGYIPADPGRSYRSAVKNACRWNEQRS